MKRYPLAVKHHRDGHVTAMVPDIPQLVTGVCFTVEDAVAHLTYLWVDSRLAYPLVRTLDYYLNPSSSYKNWLFTYITLPDNQA